MTFFGNDGTDGNTPAAEIDIEVDGTPGGNDMPGRIIFKTTKNSASAVQEKMRISSDSTTDFFYNGSKIVTVSGQSYCNGVGAAPAPSSVCLAVGRDSGSNRSINCQGHVQIASGYGIQFASSSTGAVLDDYEEGTWTPTLGGFSSIAYHNPQIGYYTKIGNIVHFTVYLYVYQATGAASNITISLPFTSTSNTGRESGAYTSYDNGFFDSSWSEKSGCAYLIGSNYSTIRPVKRINGAIIHGNDSALGTGANNRYLIIAGTMFAN